MNDKYSSQINPGVASIRNHSAFLLGTVRFDMAILSPVLVLDNLYK